MVRFSKLFFASVMAFSVAANATTTQEKLQDVKNFTRVQTLTTKKVIQEGNYRFEAVPQKGFSKNSSGLTPADSIILGYPTDLIGQGMMFGASVIKISDKNDEALGNLKLAHFTAVAKAELINNTNHMGLVIRGLPWEGGETEKPETIVEIPVTKVDTAAKMAYLDLSTLGEKLNIAQYLQNLAGEDVNHFQHIQSKTISVDFSLHTLVFDVASDYNVVTRNSVTKDIISQKIVTLTSRWFMRLNSLNNPFFERRKNTEGVGFFTTGDYNPQGDKFGWITRFPIQDLKNQPVRYYVKNIPSEHKAAMLAGFEDWNHKLQNLLGHDLLVYEFIEKDDPRYEQIMAGDVRFNVLEWDLDNKASYGGLGPSLKNALTGEVMSAQVLIQGPSIVNIYKSWFKVKEEAVVLRSKNQQALAKELENQFLKKLFNLKARQNLIKKAQIKLGEVQFNIPSQDPNLKDELAVDPLDFVQTPPGYTYETYMNGYWREITPHELGHNLGLRHNFRGNLKDAGSGKVSSVSWSVMEYLPRTHRHLNRVSEYDVMAIAYGYLGILPEYKNRFCTDGDQSIYSPLASPECSNADATNDPLTFFDQRINRGLDLLLARNSNEAPAWTINEVWGTMNPFIKVLATYATNAHTSSHLWTNFFGKPGRPKNADETVPYIIKKLNGYICGANLDADASNKSTPEGQAKAKANLEAYRNASFDLLRKIPASFTLVTKENFSCLTP